VGIRVLDFPNNWYQSHRFKESEMSKVGASSMPTKFDVEKFNGKGNFGLWQKRVKALLVQQGLHKALQGKKSKAATMTDED